jgi:hypothetical protein
MGFIKEVYVNHNRLIVGLVIFAAVIILMISGAVILLREWNGGQAKVSQRVPIPSLRYCSSDQARPCILSFHLDSDGNMLINMLIERSSPGFYVKINYPSGENIYQCRNTKGSSASVSCIGKAMPVGEVLQFLLISKKEDILLAEGRFPIIGLALATPEVATTPVSETPFTPMPTDDSFAMTPTPIDSPPQVSPSPSSTQTPTGTPTLVEGPPGDSSPPPFSTPIGTTTDGPPPSTGGPPGS